MLFFALEREEEEERKRKQSVLFQEFLDRNQLVIIGFSLPFTCLVALPFVGPLILPLFQSCVAQLVNEIANNTQTTHTLQLLFEKQEKEKAERMEQERVEKERQEQERKEREERRERERQEREERRERERQEKELREKEAKEKREREEQEKREKEEQEKAALHED